MCRRSASSSVTTRRRPAGAAVDSARCVGRSTRPLAQDDRALEDVGQLAHVARPVVRRSGARAPAGRSGRPGGPAGAANSRTKCCASSGMSSRRSRSGGTSMGKMFRRKKRSDRNAPRRTSSARSRLVAAITRAFDAHGLRAADALELLLLQHAQQLDLRVERQLADLVEEDRAVVGELEAALLLLHRAGERAALVAEELAFDERGRQRPAVHLHHHARAPAARRGGWPARSAPCPVPVSPSSSTEESVSATSSIARNTCCIAADRPEDLAEVQVRRRTPPAGRRSAVRAHRRACDR